MDVPTVTELFAGIASTFLAAVLPVLVNFFRVKATEAKHIGDKADIERNQVLIQRMKGYLWGNAAALAEDHIPRIAKRIEERTLQNPDMADVKNSLNKLGTILRNRAILYFENQGINLVKEVGDQHLIDFIRRAADDASPFPGMSTSESLLDPNKRGVLMTKGVKGTRNAVLNGGL